jgi:hypothetical protein
MEMDILIIRIINNVIILIIINVSIIGAVKRGREIYGIKEIGYKV